MWFPFFVILGPCFFLCGSPSGGFWSDSFDMWFLCCLLILVRFYLFLCIFLVVWVVVFFSSFLLFWFLWYAASMSFFLFWVSVCLFVFLVVVRAVGFQGFCFGSCDIRYAVDKRICIYIYKTQKTNRSDYTKRTWKGTTDPEQAKKIETAAYQKNKSNTTQPTFCEPREGKIQIRKDPIWG